MRSLIFWVIVTFLFSAWNRLPMQEMLILQIIIVLIHVYGEVKQLNHRDRAETDSKRKEPQPLPSKDFRK